MPADCRRAGRTTPALSNSRKFIAKVQGRLYADLLKTVKEWVPSGEVGEILFLHKGTNKDLHVRVKGAAAAEGFRNVVCSSAVGLWADLKSRESRQTIVRVKDISSHTTEKEITDALLQVVDATE